MVLPMVRPTQPPGSTDGHPAGTAAGTASSARPAAPDAPPSGAAGAGRPDLSPDDLVERAPGLRVTGRYEGSGYREERWLAVRADGQTVLLTPLLHAVVQQADGEPDAAGLAALVTDATGRHVTLPVLSALVLDRLVPAGLVVVTPAAQRGRTGGAASALAAARAATRAQAPDGARTAGHADRAGLPVADPLLAMTLDRPFMTTRLVRTLARVFAPLFTPVVVTAVLVGWVVGDRWMFGTTGLEQAFTSPGGILTVLALLLFSTLFHEVGHAAACTYGGGRPGPIGAGLYLWVPVFWTDVTDAYRLDRVGRLRTDLGGIYFNVVFIVVMQAGAWLTGRPEALAAALLTHLVILQQLLPIVRMDGYYLFGDLTGVPNPFAFTGSVLRGLVPGRGMPPRVRALRRGARIAVVGWVLVTVPLLTAVGVWLLVSLPGLLAAAWRDGRGLWADALGASGVLACVLAWICLVLLVLPFLGMGALLLRLVQRGVAAAARAVDARRPSPVADPSTTVPQEAAMSQAGMFDPPAMLAAAPPPADPDPTVGDPVTARGPSAEDFDEAVMLRRRRRGPATGWRHGVHVLTGGLVALPPSAAERRQDALVERVRTPVTRSRRVVVVSRKGGAGKTTTSLMLGHTFAMHRGDRVVALDANPDAGSLPLRVVRQTDATLTTLLADADHVDRYSRMRRFTSQAPSRLEVVASDDDPTISQSLGAHDVHRALDLLDRHYSLVLVDTGTGILDEAVQQILREADQVVVVMPPAFDGARVAASTLDWLEEHGHRRLVRSAVAVVNAVRGEGGHVLLDEIERHFSARCSAVVRIPWDRALEAGGCVGVEDLRPATRHAYLELAAAVADRFPAPGGRP